MIPISGRSTGAFDGISAVRPAAVLLRAVMVTALLFVPGLLVQVLGTPFQRTADYREKIRSQSDLLDQTTEAAMLGDVLR